MDGWLLLYELGAIAIQWLFDLIVRISSLPVGGEKLFRLLSMQTVVLQFSDLILDLCCGSGQATQYLVESLNFSSV